MNAESLQQQILELQAQLTLLQDFSVQTISSLQAELAASRQESTLLRGKLDAPSSADSLARRAKC